MTRSWPGVPRPTLAMRFVGRGAVLWVLGRALLLGLLVAGAGQAAKPGGSVGASLLVVAITGGLGLLELRRQHEHHFLANLGVSQRTAGALLTAPALVGELALFLVPWP